MYKKERERGNIETNVLKALRKIINPTFTTVLKEARDRLGPQRVGEF